MARKKRSTSRFCIGDFAYALVLIMAGVMAWYAWAPQLSHDYSALALSLDEALVDVLLEHGRTDADILEQSRAERSRDGKEWLEYYRVVSVRSRDESRRIRDALMVVADPFDVRVKERGSAVRRSLTFSRDGVPLAHIILARPGHTRSSAPHQIALVIDDLGYTDAIDKFLTLGIPVTFAIIPQEPFSTYFAKRFSKMKMPFIMHLPLEPIDYPKINPGKQALLTTMSATQMKNMFAENIASVPGVSGVSNHMGSRFSADARAMKVLLQEVKAHNLFYLDSLTTSKSKAREVAESIDLPVIVNDVFLDVHDTPAFVNTQCAKLMRLAKRHEVVVAIGHVQRDSMVPVLKEWIPKYQHEGIEFVYLVEVVHAVMD